MRAALSARPGCAGPHGRPAAERHARVVACRAAPQQPNPQQQQPPALSAQQAAACVSKRNLLLSTLAAGIAWGLQRPQPARAEDDIGERAIDEYAELESKGKLSSVRQLDDFRNKYKFKRGPDGRVSLKAPRSGTWMAVRLDMEVPGTMLLRDSKGYVYAIQTDSMQQIDLSDDQVVLLMFADGSWEQQMTPIEFTDESGKVKHLKMEERDFRSIVGLLKVAEEQGEVAAQ